MKFSARVLLARLLPSSHTKSQNRPTSRPALRFVTHKIDTLSPIPARGARLAAHGGPSHLYPSVSCPRNDGDNDSYLPPFLPVVFAEAVVPGLVGGSDVDLEALITRNTSSQTIGSVRGRKCHRCRRRRRRRRRRSWLWRLWATAVKSRLQVVHAG